MSTVKPKSLTFLFLLLAAIFIFDDVSAFSKKVEIKPKPSWLLPIKESNNKINFKEVRDGFYLSLYEEQHHVEQKACYRRVVREIISETGVQHGSQIQVSYDPVYESIAFHSIVIKRQGEMINKLPNAKFKIIQNEEDLSRFLYYGYHTAYLILDDVRKGDQIEFSYTVTGRNPVFNDKYESDIYFQTSDPVGHIYETVIFNPKRKLNFKSFHNAPQAIVSQKNGLNCYEWNLYSVKAVDIEDYQPSWFNNYPHVQITEFANWNEVVSWALKLNQPSVVISPDLQKKIDEYKKESKDEYDYFQKVVRFVQDQIRYMGVEMGAYSHKPNTTAAIFKQRYGDCKDKSLLLCTMLKSNGIDAYMVYVNTYAKARTDEFLPSASVFNHAVVNAVINGKKYWIDPTISHQRGPAHALAFPNYEKGLVIKNNTYSLTPIKMNTPGYVWLTEDFELAPNKKDVVLSVSTQYTLNVADDVRYRLANVGIQELEKSNLDYYSKVYGDVESLEEVKIEDNEEENTIRFLEKYSIKNFWKNDKESSLLKTSIRAHSLANMLIQIPGKARVAPIGLNYPYYLRYEINVQTPSPISVRGMDYELVKPEYRFISRPTSTQKSVNLYYEYEILQESVSAIKAPEFIKDVNSIKEQLEFTLTSDGSIDGKPKSNGPVWLTLFCTLLLIGGLVFGAKKIYRYSLPYHVDEYEDILPIGGWLILVAIGLCISPLLIFATLTTGGFFSEALWANLFNLKPVVSVMVILEYAINIGFIVFSVLLIIMFFKRRNTVPKLMVIFYSVYAVWFTSDMLLASWVNNTPVSYQVGKEIFLVILRVAIFIPYFILSSRVKQTFVFTHPEYMNNTDTQATQPVQVPEEIES